MNKYKCIIDRPIGYKDKFDNIYPINYGFVEGYLVAKIVREDDVEDKWVLSNKKVTKEEIIEKTLFIEQYFKSKVVMIEE